MSSGAVAPTAEMSQVEHATLAPQSPPQSLREITASLPPIVSDSAETQPPNHAPSAAMLQPQTQTHTPAGDTIVATELQRPEPALLPPPAAPQEVPLDDDTPPITSTALLPGAAVHITLLLTTGARHPFTIDQKYLKRRHVASVPATGTAEQHPDTDPFEISVYTLKELIWKDWREEWEPRPSTPTLIRLIHFGKLLDDKMSLKDCKFLPDTPNVVHMTVKPQHMVDEDEHATVSKGGRASAAREGGFRCCSVM